MMKHSLDQEQQQIRRPGMQSTYEETFRMGYNPVATQHWPSRHLDTQNKLYAPLN